MQGNVNIPDSTITTNLSFRQLVLMNMQQLTNFPYIEKDFDALTDYELLCLVVKFLNDVIANQNEQNASITRMYESFLALQTYVNNTKDTLEDAFNELDDYVRNYFDNLDVQDEIDHKLDEMVEAGTLEAIIASYLQTQKIYNTHVEMIADASNLVKGLNVQTLGYYTLNDGGGAFYQITDTESQTEYQEDLGNNLYATLLNYNYINIKQLGAKGDGTSDDTNVLKNILENIVNDGYVVYIPKGIYTFTGTITCNKSIKITGDYSRKYHYDICVFKNNGTGGMVFTGGNVIIENIDFVGNEETSSFALKMLGGRPNIINCCINHFDNSTGLFIGEDSEYHNTDLFVLHNLIINYCDIGIHMGSAVAPGTTLVDNNAGTSTNITITRCRIGLDIKNSNNNNFLSFEVDNCSEYGIKFTNASRNYFVNPYMECTKNLYFDNDSKCNKIIGSRGAGWVEQNEGNVDDNMILGNMQSKGIYDIYQYLNTQTFKIAKQGQSGSFDFNHDTHTLSIKHNQSGGVIDLSNPTYKQTTKVDRFLLNSTIPITGTAHNLGIVNNITIPANGVFVQNVVNENVTPNNFSDRYYNLWHPNITFATDLPNGVIATVEARNGMFTFKLYNTTSSDISYTSFYTIAAIKVYAD